MAGLSVIIPNYNHARYLPESLEAILSQTYKPLEVIVVDDASTDASCEVVAEYQKTCPYLHLVRLNQNSGGPTRPIHEGLRKAKGEYLALCASDDIIGPSFFEDAMKLLEKHPDVGICFGDFAIFQDQKPYQLKKISLFPAEGPLIFTPEMTVEACRKYRFYIPSQTTIYKKKLVCQYGGYDSKLETLADFYLNCRIAFQHPIGYIPKTLGSYRIRDDSYARSARFEIKKRNRVFAFLMKKLAKEDVFFQQKLKKSGILAHAGLYMIIYLALRPHFWSYLIPSLKKRFKL